MPVTSIQAWNISSIPGLEKEERQGGREERKEKEEGHGGREVEGEWGEKWRKGGEGRVEGKVHESGKERSGGREGGGRRERVEEVEGKEGGGGRERWEGRKWINKTGNIRRVLVQQLCAIC